MTEPIIHEPALSILEYADKVAHVDHRTVREWIRRGLLEPAPYQDGSRKWWIPMSARKVEAPVAPRLEPRSTDLETRAPSSSPLEKLIMSPPPFIPLYMPLEEAAPLLGVTAYQIAQHPDEFDVRPWGANGSLVVPVRRLLGMTS